MIVEYIGAVTKVRQNIAQHVAKILLKILLKIVSLLLKLVWFYANYRNDLSVADLAQLVKKTFNKSVNKMFWQSAWNKSVDNLQRLL